MAERVAVRGKVGTWAGSGPMAGFGGPCAQLWAAREGGV